MARLGFGLAALASLGFGVWFGIIESNSPGISYGISLIGMSFVLAIFGFAKVAEEGILPEGKTAAWISFFCTVAGAGYLMVVFPSWRIPAAACLAMQIPMIALVLDVAKPVEKIRPTDGPPSAVSPIEKR